MNAFEKDPAALRGVTPGARGAKAKIERAALGLFCQRGVDAVTTREIASASGVSEGALYRHYQSKESLAETMFFSIHMCLAREIETAVKSASNLEAQARAIVSAYLRIADSDWTLFAYHLLTTHRFLPHADKTPELSQPLNPVAIVENVISDAMRSGALPAGDANLKAACALGVVLQAALHKVYGRISGDLSAHEDALADAVVAVLQS